MGANEEQKAVLENNIQTALQAGLIDLTDAIDIREIRNLKLANQLLKVKRKALQDQQQQQAMQAQAMQAQQALKSQDMKAQLIMQQQQAEIQGKMQLKQAEIAFEIEKQNNEANLKSKLMAEEFNYQMQLAQIKANAEAGKIAEVEDRKDKRTKIQATQQSKMIEQRQNDLLPTDFESAGNDNLGGFGLEQFTPQ